MNEKTSLKIYREWRQEKRRSRGSVIKNSYYGSQLLFKCQTNNLQLNDINRFRGKETACDVCGAEREDLTHYWCLGHCEVRGKSVKPQQPYIQEEEELVGRFLFENRDIQETKRETTSFWKIREKIREEERNRHVSY